MSAPTDKVVVNLIKRLRGRKGNRRVFLQWEPTKMRWVVQASGWPHDQPYAEDASLIKACRLALDVIGDC